MTEQNIIYYNPAEESESEDLSINIEKIWNIIWSRKGLIIKVFCSVLIFFIALTFIQTKKYKVTADIYINKTNSSNMMEFNPYMLDDAASSIMASMGADKAISNEMELMKSALVLDKVIRENHIVYKKLFGIFPNKKEGEYVTAKGFYKKGKILKIENVKNSNVISIEYKASKPELAYGVVSSLLKNYTNLHKEINIEKSKADKKLLEAEYAKAKANLDKKLSQSSGLPPQAITGVGNLSALSAFSRTAAGAIGSLKSQYIEGERSQIAVSEEKQKLAQLASKLEWANIVEQMSDSSKVLVINEPQKLRDFEYSSPKLLINIIIGIIFGGLASLIALILAELRDEKLTYSMLSNNILSYNTKNIEKMKLKLFSFNPQKIAIITMVEVPEELSKNLKELSNVSIVPLKMTDTFINKISGSDKFVICSKISETSADTYKMLRGIIKNQNKDILYDILM